MIRTQMKNMTETAVMTRRRRKMVSCSMEKTYQMMTRIRLQSSIHSGIQRLALRVGYEQPYCYYSSYQKKKKKKKFKKKEEEQK